MKISTALTIVAVAYLGPCAIGAQEVNDLTQRDALAEAAPDDKSHAGAAFKFSSPPPPITRHPLTQRPGPAPTSRSKQFSVSPGRPTPTGNNFHGPPRATLTTSTRKRIDPVTKASGRKTYSTLPPYVFPTPTIARTITISVTAQPTATPNAKPSVKQEVYKYRGCYLGNGLTATDGPAYVAGSPAKCAAACADWKLFSIEGLTCDCGNNIMDLYAMNDAQCTANKCEDDNSEACGNTGLLLVYAMDGVKVG